MKFLIDVDLELLIFYEQEYEIYGDIRGASRWRPMTKPKVREEGRGGGCRGE